MPDTRPVRTHDAVLEALLEVRGRDVVDVGCGDGRLTRLLGTRGARTVGVDPSAAALEEAALADAGATGRWLQGTAEALPVADATADVVVFLNSLHHVAATALDQALREAARVLRPGGLLYVQEPLAEGPYHDVIRLLEDEAAARAAAQEAVRRAAAGDRFEAVDELEYAAPVRHHDFDAFRRRMVLTEPGRAAALDAHAADVERAFIARGRDDDGAFAFEQPTRVCLLRRRG